MARMADVHSREFRLRRRLNWIPLGLMYGSYYMTRYNLSFANKSISEEFGWSKQEIGWILTSFFWAYAIGQFINGQITDRIGGRKAIMAGAIATIILNVLFGLGARFALISYFIVIWGLNGYFQAFGAPSIVKVNANWFSINERGTFTGIFGLMIQFGRWAITLLGGFLIVVAPWQYVFWIPSVVVFAVTILTYFTVRDNPEDVGLSPVEQADAHGIEDHKAAGFAFTLRKVLTSRVLWIISVAYFCTGVVRHGLEQWFPRYLQEVHGLNPGSFAFQVTALGMPIAAVLGAFVAGYVSDYLFDARRGPAAALLYFSQAILLLLFYIYSGPIISGVLLLLLSFAVNGPHSLLGGAAAMDFGGRKAAGSAAGMIDCWQYVGAGLSGFGVGAVLDKFSWDGWAVSLIGFAVVGGIAMSILWNAKPKARRKA